MKSISLGTKPLSLLKHFLTAIPAVMVFMVVGGIFISALSSGGNSFFQHQVSLSLISNTLVLMSFVLLFSTWIATPMAIVQVYFKLRYAKFIELLFVLPMTLPSYFSAFCYSSLLAKGGILHQHLPPEVYSSLPEIYGLPGSVLVLTSICYPYLYFAIKHQLEKIDATTWQSAKILEPSRLRRWRKIAWPAILPALSSGALIIALYVLSDFGAVSIMRFDTLTSALYSRLTSALDKQAASIISLLLLAISLFIIFGESYFHRIRELHEYKSTHNAFQQRRMSRKSWFLFLIYFLPVVLVCLLSPILTLSYWLFTGTAVSEYRFSFKPLIFTMTISVISAILISLITFILVKAKQTHQHWWMIWAERIQYLGYALPGLVIALGFIQLSLNLFPVIYNTFLLLVIAYFVHFSPQAISSLRSYSYLIQPEIDQSARLLEKSSTKVFTLVQLPLMRAPLFAAFFLCFISILKELPTTMLLAPAGFSTLAMKLWSYTEEAMFMEAAIPTLQLFICGTVPMAIYLIYQNKPSH